MRCIFINGWESKITAYDLFFFLTSVNVDMFNLEKNNHIGVPKGNTYI